MDAHIPKSAGKNREKRRIEEIKRVHYLQKATKQLLRAAKRLEIAEINRSSA
jgi:hypothetical protein